MTEPDNAATTVKPFKDYPELVDILQSRGMTIGNRDRAIRKIAQVGYYHLSGYWHSSRKYRIEGREKERVLHYLDEFQDGTSFEAVFQFYLMDKTLRMLLSDALERIEVYLRTIIAHELGRQDPLAHFDRENFAKMAFARPAGDLGGGLSLHDAWLARHEKLIEQSREDSIRSHVEANKPIPIWVASEAWDFGLISKLYSMLNVKNQDSICARLNIVERNVVDNWLINLNGVRNRCAHHARLCNRPNPRVFKLPRRGYFNDLQLDHRANERFYGLIAVVWYLLKTIGPNSGWLMDVADVLDAMPRLPGLTSKSMGFPEGGFPRAKFPITVKPVVVSLTLEEVCASTLASFTRSQKTILSFPVDDASSNARKKFADDVLDLIADI